MLPGSAGVRRLVNAIPRGEVGPLQALAAAHVNDAGVGRRYGNGPHRAGRLTVEDGIPGPAEIRRLPDPAVHGGDVEQVGLAGNTGHGHGPPAPKRTDHPPLHFGVKAGIELLGKERLADEEEQSRAEPDCQPANVRSRTNHGVLPEGGIYMQEGSGCKFQTRNSRLRMTCELTSDAMYSRDPDGCCRLKLS